MKYSFRTLRSVLFTNSYAGYYFSNFIRHSEKPGIWTKQLARVLLFNTRLLRCFVYHKTCQRKFSKIATEISKKDEKIKVYINVEKELITLIKERKDKNNIILEDYEYALLEPAIERVAGNALVRVDNDGEFEEKLIGLIKIYRRFYYDVAYKYKLPTLRIVPFILRLIKL